MSRTLQLLLAAVILSCCGCATFQPAVFPAFGITEKSNEKQVIRPAKTVRITLQTGDTIIGDVVSVSEKELVLETGIETAGTVRKYQISEIRSAEIKRPGLSDTAMFVSIAGVSALVAVLSLSGFEEPDY